MSTGRPVTRRVARVVVLLGVVSLLTDLSSEMVVAVLPVYLTVTLGLTPVQYGIVDGLYQGVSAVVRIAAGIGSDLTRRPKVFAALGYGLSCLCKLALLPASTFLAVSSVVSVDRVGKGLRTAPRDAMIAAASDPSVFGFAFGVHRAMDTLGALGGPLIAFGLLGALPGGYDALFVASFGLAAIGVAVLVLFVPNTAAAQPEPSHARWRAVAREMARLSLRPRYRRTLLVAALVSLTTIGDGFVYLVLRERTGISGRAFPLLYVGSSAVYLLLAIPAGRLADRIGRARIFLAGNAIAVLAYIALLRLAPGPILVAVVLILAGTYYACTDGVLSALTAPLVPAAVRTTGLAGVQTVTALGNLLSAIGFGAVWAAVGSRHAVAGFAAALAVAVAVSAFLLRARSDA